MSQRPLVIAHRGASADYAEHTLPAYLRAIEVGVDGVECDVRLTRDGHLVCVHDRSIGRTSNGWGWISTKTLAQLQHFDFGSWHAAGNRSEVLTFRALLELVRDSPRPVRLFVETKHPTRSGPAVEESVVAELKRVGWADNGNRGWADNGNRGWADNGNRGWADNGNRGWADNGNRGWAAGDRGDGARSPVTVMSFSATALRRIHRLAPALPTVQLMDSLLTNPWVTPLINRWPQASWTGLLPDPVSIAGPNLRVLRSDPGLAERAHALGKKVYVWTVNTKADAQYLADLGVDAIITDHPAEILAGFAA